MDKFMHKVKEAISGHHDEKDSSHGSSKMGIDQNSNDPSKSMQGANMGPEHVDMGQDDRLDTGNSPISNKQFLSKDPSTSTDDAYASKNPSSGDGPLNSNKLENTTGDTYGSKSAEKEVIGSDLEADNLATGNMVKDTENPYGDNTYGSTNTGMDSGSGIETKKFTGQNMGGYGGLGPDPHKDPDYNSANMGGYGTAVNDLRDSDKKIGIDKALNLENRGDFGNTTAVTSGGNDLKPNDSNMIGNSGNTDAGKQGFGGTAAGGSSYNSPASGKRRSSGPHKSNFLNSLDPRVHKADYVRNTEDEGKMVGNQRGF